MLSSHLAKGSEHLLKQVVEENFHRFHSFCRSNCQEAQDIGPLREFARGETYRGSFALGGPMEKNRIECSVVLKEHALVRKAVLATFRRAKKRKAKKAQFCGMKGSFGCEA